MPDERWRQVVVSRLASAQGGYSGAAQAVSSNEVPYAGRVVSFVRINRNSLWVLKTCGGKACQPSGLRRTRVIEELRSLCEISNKENGADDTPVKAAVADVNDPLQLFDDNGDATE